MSIEILTMLKAKSGMLEFTGGGIPALVPQDVLAAMGMQRIAGRRGRVRLSDAAVAWGRYLVLQDATCGDQVASALMRWVFMKLATDNPMAGWEKVSVSQIIGLTKCAMHERLRQRTHKSCLGEGCDACSGSGIKRLSLCEKAQLSGITKSTWHRYQRLLDSLSDSIYNKLGDLENELSMHLNVVLFAKNESLNEGLNESLVNC